MGGLPLPLMTESEKVLLKICFDATSCEHRACEPLKQHGLCNHWFFMRWPASTTTQPSKMLRVLREQLGEREFRYCAALTEQGVFEVLVRFNYGVFPGQATPYLVPKSGTWKFDVSQCEAWPLDCCRDAFDADARLWVRRLTDGDGRFIFGDKALPHDLLSEVRAAGGSVVEA